ncbi:hypothetical protein PoB_000197500 [Plakobranchus ocellatus]|uniref:Uncharacterized protein n=1 Tax=Plakobranchus ocellatus TaxID=259542 RepID=A0AAV3XXF1_9GAST|nr:hypothetical protein PoB_000197500 [Plakobranchus ocellatus]
MRTRSHQAAPCRTKPRLNATNIAHRPWGHVRVRQTGPIYLEAGANGLAFGASVAQWIAKPPSDLQGHFDSRFEPYYQCPSLTEGLEA